MTLLNIEGSPEKLRSLVFLFFDSTFGPVLPLYGHYCWAFIQYVSKSSQMLNYRNVAMLQVEQTYYANRV